MCSFISWIESFSSLTFCMLFWTWVQKEILEFGLMKWILFYNFNLREKYVKQIVFMQLLKFLDAGN